MKTLIAVDWGTSSLRAAHRAAVLGADPLGELGVHDPLRPLAGEQLGPEAATTLMEQAKVEAVYRALEEHLPEPRRTVAVNRAQERERAQ